MNGSDASKIGSALGAAMTDGPMSAAIPAPRGKEMTPAEAVGRARKEGNPDVLYVNNPFEGLPLEDFIERLQTGQTMLVLYEHEPREAAGFVAHVSGMMAELGMPTMVTWGGNSVWNPQGLRFSYEKQEFPAPKTTVYDIISLSRRHGCFQIHAAQSDSVPRTAWYYSDYVMEIHGDDVQISKSRTGPHGLVRKAIISD